MGYAPDTCRRRRSPRLNRPRRPDAAFAGLIRNVAARTFVFVVKADGSVVSWGNNQDGLATRPRSEIAIVEVPTAIDLPGKARQMALGESSAYALLEDGSVVAWGANDEGQLGNGAIFIEASRRAWRPESPRPLNRSRTARC